MTRSVVQRPVDGADRRGQYGLIAILGALLSASALLAVLLTKWGIDWRASMSFAQADGHCDPATEAIRQHCWGDFAAIRFDSLASIPEGPEALYPMATRLLRFPFAVLEQIAGFHVSLVAWLAVLLVATVGPIVWATWHYPWLPRTAAIVVCGLLTMPTLVILDRGNVIGLAVTAMLLFAIGVLRDRPWLAAAGVVASAAVKPQFALLIVLLVALRWWKPLSVAAFGLAAVALVPPLVAGGRGLPGAFDWVGASMDWSREQSVSETWPVNASLAHGFSTAAEALAGLSRTAIDPGNTGRIAQGLALALVGVAMLLIAWRGASMERQRLVAAVLCSASLAVPVAYAYYLAFAIPVCAIYLAYGGPQRQSGWKAIGWGPGLLLVAVVLSLTPLVLAVSPPSYRDPGPVVIVESLFPVLAALAWSALLAQTCLELALHRKDVPDALTRS